MPHRSHPPAPRTAGASKKEILELTRANNVRFLRLQFTDILGVNKNVEIPASQFEKALDGDIMFDGSSIEGFVRIEESDMLLAPDLSTFQIFPWESAQNKVARIICDINTPDGEPFAGDPRGALKRQIALARKHGYTMNAGMEAEFFMFKRAADGSATTETHDVGAYFDLAPVDLGEDARRERSSTSSSAWASRWRRRTTRWRTGSTRSISAMRTRSRRRTTSRLSASW